MTTPNGIALVLPSRRLFLFETTAATLSGTAIALHTGAPRLAQAASHAGGWR